MYTTFAAIVENGAFLDSSPVKGLVFLAGMILAGVIANEMGRIFVSIMVMRKEAPTVKQCLKPGHASDASALRSVCCANNLVLDTHTIT